jgi:hypothetical protein
MPVIGKRTAGNIAVTANGITVKKHKSMKNKIIYQVFSSAF